MKNNNPKISVVMSTYSEPLKWIKESIDSILKQTFTDFEFIIINDNPGRVELQVFLKKYKKQDRRIILIKNNKNIGLTKSLNNGLKISKGKYIARMDADDISIQNRFEIQYRYMEKHKNIFLIDSGVMYIKENKEKIKLNISPVFHLLIKFRLKTKNCLCHPAIMFRNEENYYNENFKYAQDYGFYLSLLKKGKKFKGIPKILLKYRINSKSISENKKNEQDGFVKLAKKLYLN